MGMGCVSVCEAGQGAALCFQGVSLSQQGWKALVLLPSLCTCGNKNIFCLGSVGVLTFTAKLGDCCILHWVDPYGLLTGSSAVAVEHMCSRTDTTGSPAVCLLKWLGWEWHSLCQDCAASLLQAPASSVTGSILGRKTKFPTFLFLCLHKHRWNNSDWIATILTCSEFLCWHILLNQKESLQSWQEWNQALKSHHFLPPPEILTDLLFSPPTKQ